MTEAAEFYQIYKLGVVPIPTNQPMIRAGPGRPRLQDRGRQVRRGRRGHRRAAREGPAGPGRHHQRREVRAARPALLKQARRPARGAERQAARAGGGDRRRRPAARARSRWPRTWPAAAPTSCSAATPSSWPTTSCARAASTRPRRRRSTRRRGPTRSSRSRSRSRPSTTRSSRLGGLYVLGTERHESRRIDNQLRGRSGRQGDPGESRFYLSLEDDLMRLFNAAMVEIVPDPRNIPDDVADRVEDRHQRDPRRAGPGRGAELRDPQERPQVRRRAEPAARGHLRRAPPGAGGRGPARADPPHPRRRRSTGYVRARPRRGSPRTGTWTSCGPR